ncbi:MAG: AraC family transcriptional regulator [Lachnospiraceae bacterium]|nr:AraC family transcriptional regulator [Lachnospiraceae bacterium]
MRKTTEERTCVSSNDICRMKSAESGLIPLECSDGEGWVRCYQVFPGIQLRFYDIHGESYWMDTQAGEEEFEIIHCREGRVEECRREHFYCLSAGDLTVCPTESGRIYRHFPLRHYHGMTIIVNLRQAPRCLSCFLEDVNVEPGALREKFCSSPGAFVARSQPAVAHIFSELYSVPEKIQKGYFKVKVLELFLFLSCVDISTDEWVKRNYSPSQRQLAMEICDYLNDHMDRRVTIEQLAGRFHVSETQIKASVKSVCGVSVSSYIRMLKMKTAARMLRDTDLTVLQVSSRFGYDNASKFSSAFKKVMGVTPKEYRNLSDEELISQ